MKDKYDVIVVGGGPAGSTCALHLSREGLEVLLVEKRQEIGEFIRCAGGVLAKDKEELFPTTKAIVGSFRVFRVVVGEKRVDIPAEDGEWGFVLERKIFDQEIALLAAKAGVRILVGAKVEGLMKEDGKVKGVVIKRGGEKKEVKGNLVVSADGVESRVARWGGIDTRLSVGKVLSCAQFLLYHPSIEKGVCEIHLGRELAPGGYAWVVPREDGTAVVGLGVAGWEGQPLARLRRFVEEKFPSASILEQVVGGTPVSPLPKRIYGDGIVAVGDSARQADPVTGAGIAQAIRSAKLAVEVIRGAFEKGDVSKKSLSSYQKRWEEKFGKAHRYAVGIRSFLSSLSTREMCELLDTLEKIKVGGSARLIDIIWLLVKQNPRFLLKLPKILVP